MRKLAQLDKRERSAMLESIESVLADRINRGSMPTSTGFGG